MAVIDGVEGVKVTICVDGQEAAEHADPNPIDIPAFPGAKQAHKYIESHDEQEYFISISTNGYLFHSEKQLLLVGVFVDGLARSVGRVITRSATTCNILGVEDETPEGTILLHKFRFSKVTTVEEADEQKIADDKTRAKYLGCIWVMFRRAEFDRLGNATPTEQDKSRDFRFAEKAMKMHLVHDTVLSHGTSFSPPVAGTDRRLLHVKNESPVFAVFSFKYRSLGALQAGEIIPSVSRPGDDVSEMSREQLESMAREHLANQVKKEEEVPQRPLRIKRSFDEIVDLTDESRPPKILKVKRNADMEFNNVAALMASQVILPLISIDITMDACQDSDHGGPPEKDMLGSKSRQSREIDFGNPLSGLSSTELASMGLNYAVDMGLNSEEDLRAFRLGAQVAAVDQEYVHVAGLSPEEIKLMSREKTHRWSLPSLVIRQNVVKSLCAIIQGMDETVVNGAQVFYKVQLGIVSAPGNGNTMDDATGSWILGLTNCAPYMVCALLGCWLTAPLNTVLGRRGTLFFCCAVSTIACIAQAFLVTTWWHMFIARCVLGLSIGPKSATTPMYAAETSPTNIRGALVMG
ncbi:hypothetical protein MKZ38_005967 [Zalerion maritima]|uniref:Major facilitator superfamily (MFS) profile domain-containing protein n=1 Tax=Zalerion maritima TaxID=339359 RepID=A0AAD5WU43_9PEZI|nr:hypothetical protein MKZ38_005967 [Zalerion maritima]